MAFMRTKATIDPAGRLVLPKPIRESLKLSPGDELEIELVGNEVILRPAQSAGVHKEQGIWVLRAGEPLTLSSINEAIRKSRSERESATFGEDS